MFLAGLLHVRELITIKGEILYVPPIEGCGIHGEAWCHTSVGSDDYIVLPGATIPFGEAELAILVLNDSSGFLEHGSGFGLRCFAIPVPADIANV